MQQPSVRTEYEKRLVAFYRYLQEIQKQDSTADMGRLSLYFLQEWFQFDLIWIAQYNAQSQTLNGLDGILPKPERDAAFLRRKQAVLPGDLFDQVLLTGTLQEIPSLKQEQRVGDWQALANRQNVQGTVILPMRYRHQSLGILVVSTALWGGHPRPEEMIELKMFAGALAAEWYRLSGCTNVSAPQQPAQHLSVISQILAAPTFDDRLKLVLEYTHQVIQPSRICFYQFSAEDQLCRLQEAYTGPPLKRSGSKAPPSIEITLQAIASFYQSSLQNQTVVIADVQGLVNSNQAPTRLMNLTRTRAWLSVPIIDKGRLIAVLAAEENEPRLWNDADKQSVQLMAQLLAQGAQGSSNSYGNSEKTEPFGLSGLLSILKETNSDSHQWDKTLAHCLEQVGLQFAVRWAAVFTHDSEAQQFNCRAQFFHKKKQPLLNELPHLSDVDTKMLARMSVPIAMQSLEQDLRLLAWRQPLSDRGVQSLLLLKLSPSAKLGSFLLIATDLPRTWTPEEIETARLVAEPLGQALERQDQWQQDAAQVQFMHVLNQGLQTIQQASPHSLFSATAQALHQLLDVECLLLLRWSPDQPEAEVAELINHSKFQINTEVPINWVTDGFLQWVLGQAEASTSLTLPCLVTERGSIEDLAAQNSGWLVGMGRVELLGVPLQMYQDDPCLGLLLVLDSRRQYWSDLKCEGIQLLMRELTAHHRSYYSMQRLQQKQQTLECLNWYKQRHLEHLARLWTEQMSKFQVLLSTEAAVATGQGVAKTRNRHPAGELYSAFSTLETILKTEVWDLKLEPELIPVATLLRRSLERIEEVVRARQLWTQVHNLTPSVSLQMPGQKLELMLVELLLAACYRSKVGDRIDIWCRALPEQWVEISITDNGRLNPLLVSAIQNPAPQMPLAASILESLPGLHFKVCQSLVERLGGQIELAQLEDGRALSRLILPLASAVPSTVSKT